MIAVEQGKNEMRRACAVLALFFCDKIARVTRIASGEKRGAWSPLRLDEE